MRISVAGRGAESIGRILAGGRAADEWMSAGREVSVAVLESVIDPAADALISDDRESPVADPTLAAGRESGIGPELIAARESRSFQPRVRTLADAQG